MRAVFIGAALFVIAVTAVAQEKRVLKLQRRTTKQ